jgi:hypothetical protein
MAVDNKNSNNNISGLWIRNRNPDRDLRKRIKLRKMCWDLLYNRFDIHRDNFADFILDLRNCYSHLLLYIGFNH